MKKPKALKYMRTFHFKRENDFSIFIEKREGTYFHIWGSGRAAHAPGRYIENSEALQKMEELRNKGYKARVGTVDPRRH
jgi:hypothetical protein